MKKDATVSDCQNQPILQEYIYIYINYLVPSSPIDGFGHLACLHNRHLRIIDSKKGPSFGEAIGSLLTWSVKNKESMKQHPPGERKIHLSKKKKSKTTTCFFGCSTSWLQLVFGPCILPAAFGTAGDFSFENVHETFTQNVFLIVVYIYIVATPKNVHIHIGFKRVQILHPKPYSIVAATAKVNPSCPELVGMARALPSPSTLASS